MKSYILKQLEIARKAADQLCFFETFYERFHPIDCKVALQPENHHKNIYAPYALPFDYNLIPNMGYINASPMSLGGVQYIASQGPLKHTLPEFWQMVWSQNCGLILSVSNPYEIANGFHFEKFEKFWPVYGQKMEYGGFKIDLLKHDLLIEWKPREERIHRRILQISQKEEKREINHLFMENWPDNGVISPEGLFHLKEAVDRLKDGKPIVVHCAGGIGRTGTFIGAHSLYQEMKELLYLQVKENIPFNVFKRVQEMRQLRYGTMVATKEQYLLLIDSLKIAIANI